MNQLPFFPLSVDTLIPHANNIYSFTYEIKLEKDSKLNTANISLNNVFYEDAFILVPLLNKNNPLDVGSFCTLNGTSKLTLTNSIEITFFITSHFQVELFTYFDNLTLTFKEKEFLNQNSLYRELKDLKTLIKKHKDLQELKNILSFKERNCLKFFNKLFVFLNSSSKDELTFYTTNDLEKRYFIICKQLTALLLSKTTVGDALGNLPEYVLEKKEKETQRLSNLNSMSSDYSATLDYLDVINSIPWSMESQIKVNINDIQTNLNKTHYGLTEVKENILQYFALEQLTQKQIGNVFLFLGPPGTGKTTIAKAIASSVGREYIQISLAGISDEAEIRGHRRTYVGSKPGRIVSAFLKCNTMNPLILLDEIDKVSSAKGDPNAALLELLDAVQNTEFLDKYLEIPIDLSKCIFICTANYKEKISTPLLDRMEVINFFDYNKQEKKIILKDYIIPNLANKYCLTKYNITFTNCIKEKLINCNLRDITKNVSRMYRYAAHQILIKNVSEIIINIEVYEQLYKRKKESKGLGFVTHIQHNEHKNSSSQKDNK